MIVVCTGAVGGLNDSSVGFGFVPKGTGWGGPVNLASSLAIKLAARPKGPLRVARLSTPRLHISSAAF